ncbi:hypothetical protein [Roseovarius tolerans]|nr:hypothetical protein [Roseovarius tolerans]
MRKLRRSVNSVGQWPEWAENANHVWVDTRGRKVDLLCERKAIMPLR